MRRPLKFTFLQISFVFLLSVGLTNHVLIIPVVLDVARRDAWLSAIAAFLLFLPCGFMIAYILNHTGANRPVLDWLRERYGRWLSATLATVVSLHLLLSACVTGQDMKIWTNSSYLLNTPPFIIGLTFAALCYYLAASGIRSIVYSSSILLPIVFVLGEFVMTFNLPQKDYSLTLPMFEFGTKPMWSGILYVESGFLELVYLIFLKPYVSVPVKARHILVLGLLLAGMTVGPIVGAIAEFGPTEAALLRFPAFEEWRLVRIGSYIEHVDFLSIFQWLSGAFVRIGLFLFLSWELWTGKRKWLLLVLAAVLAAGILKRIGDIVFLRMLQAYYFPFTFYMLLGLLLALFILVIAAKGKESDHARASG